jgi:hypothetical protein
VLGKHFRLSCWRKGHGGRTLFDSQDLGLPEDFFANLDAVVDELTDVAMKVDGWSRAGTLKDSFPKSWVGMTRWQVLKSLREQARQQKAVGR